jgi:hypothetical protein
MWQCYNVKNHTCGFATVIGLKMKYAPWQYCRFNTCPVLSYEESPSKTIETNIPVWTFIMIEFTAVTGMK